MKQPWYAFMQDSNFTAWSLHFWSAAFIVLVFGHLIGWVAAFIALGVIFPLAAWKEFYFDAKYEQNPPQTFHDNLMDFIWYIAGGAVGLLVSSI